MPTHTHAYLFLHPTPPIPVTRPQVDYRALVDDQKARGDLEVRMRQDRIRRRRNMLPARTLPEVHQAIGLGVARGDPLHWLTDAENKEKRERAALRRRLAAEAAEEDAAARPDHGHGIHRSMEEQAVWRPSSASAGTHERQNYPHKLPWGWQGGRDWRTLAEMFDENHPQLAGSGAVRFPQLSVQPPGSDRVAGGPGNIPSKPLSAGARPLLDGAMGGLPAVGEAMVGGEGGSDAGHHAALPVRSTLVMPTGVDPAVLEAYIHRQRSEVDRITSSLVGEGGVIADRRVVERALLTPADRPVHSWLDMRTGWRKAAGGRNHSRSEEEGSSGPEISE